MQDQHSCLVDAFNFILKLGAENKPNVLRALVGRLTAQWFHSPGGSVKRRSPGMDSTAVVFDRESLWYKSAAVCSLFSRCDPLVTSPLVLGFLFLLVFPNPASSLCSTSYHLFRQCAQPRAGNGGGSVVQRLGTGDRDYFQRRSKVSLFVINTFIY